MSQLRKKFAKYSDKTKDKIANDEVLDDLDKEMKFLESQPVLEDALQLEEKQEEIVDLNLLCSSIENERIPDDLLEAPLFGNFCNKRRDLQHCGCDKIHLNKTGDVDEYLQIMYTKFAENFGLNNNLLEEYGNSYSDSDSDSGSESSFDFE